MSKRLKLVSVRLKSDRGVYKNATFATATDVAFLMAKEIAGFDNETIGVLNLNAKGNLLSMNVVTLNAFEKNMSDIVSLRPERRVGMMRKLIKSIRKVGC